MSNDELKSRIGEKKNIFSKQKRSRCKGGLPSINLILTVEYVYLIHLVIQAHLHDHITLISA